MIWRRRQEAELQRDVAEHLAMETQDNIARGMDPVEARNAALRKFGNVAHVLEDTRNVWGWTALDTWYADVRQAFRRIRRSPGTALLAIASLALAFAPSVTVFSVMDRLFLTSLPIQAPGEIVEIRFRDTQPDARYTYLPPSYPDYQDLHRSLQSFSGMTFMFQQGAMVVAEGRRLVSGVNVVSDDYFSVLGIPMRLGPGFLKNRDSLIISHAMWTREFDGRSDIVGRDLLVNGFRFTIGGVADPDFRGTNRFLAPDLWIPVETWMTLQPQVRKWRGREVHDATVWARLRPGVSMAQAAAEVESVARDLGKQYPATNRYLSGHVFAPIADQERGGMASTTIAVTLLGILLAVACANVAGVLLARAEERRHETAIRQALGASRSRLVREWIVESMVLSFAGAAFGLGGARVLTRLLPGILPAMLIPFHFEFSFGLHVWLYAGALVLVSAVTFGLVPAWRGSRPDLIASLQRDSAATFLRVRVPVRSLLIVAQVAAAEILLFAAGVVLDMTSAARRIDPGFDPGRKVAIAAVFTTSGNGSFRELNYDAVVDRLSRIPGVRRVAYGRSVPVSWMQGPAVKLQLPGQEPREIRGGSAGPDFLSMLGVRMASGRDLRSSDQHGALVNMTLARQLDPAAAVVGREIRVDGTARQIVGVFHDVAWGTIYDPPQPRVLALTPARSGGDTNFTIEVEGNPEAYTAVLRNELVAAQPGLTVASSKTLRQHYQDSMFLERTAMKLFYGLGLLALVLTVAGLHGITSALFARRSKEYAIRLALGATPRQIVGSVLAGGLKLSACGLLLGLAAAVPIGMWLAARFHGMSPWTLPAVGLSSAIVLAASLAAAASPARRVLRLQPGEIVRSE